jgi:deazaflavin-dependent oxidoreductase (nitroreductase family)
MARYSTQRGRRLTAYEQAAERFVTSRAGTWLFMNVYAHVDRRLMPLTRARLSLAPGAPVGVLETRGARSGSLRHSAMLFMAAQDAIVVVASNGGAARHPGWLHNVRADPDVRFLARGRGWRDYRAHVAAGAERERLWPLLCDLYAGYRAYAERAGARELPVVVLEPR